MWKGGKGDRPSCKRAFWAWARSGRGYRRLRQVSPETVGCPRRPRSLQEVSEWPQAAPHKSTFSIRPGVGDRAQHSVCLPGPGGPPAPQHLSTLSLPTVLMSQALRPGREPKGVSRCMFSLDHPRFAARGLRPPQSCTRGAVTGAVLLVRAEAGISSRPGPALGRQAEPAPPPRAARRVLSLSPASWASGMSGWQAGMQAEKRCSSQLCCQGNKSTVGRKEPWLKEINQ